jgi:hypothetical protein
MNAKRLTRLTAVLLIVGVRSSPVFSQPESPPEISAELMHAIEEASLATLSFGETVRPEIDRSAFDEDVLLDRLTLDDAEIVRFVTENIAYEPYAGVLRGAHGTLLARAGNALDQSLLLATLLKDAGYETVIRAGTLSSGDAERLVRGLARRPPPPPPWDEKVVDRAQAEWLEHSRALLKADPPDAEVPSRDEVNRGIGRDRDDLLTALETAGVRLGDDANADATIHEASRYFWVEYRTGPARPWIPVHAAFGGGPPPEVAVAETYVDEIPSELTHRLRIELLVDQRIGTEIRTTPLMAPMEFPSANVAGRSISLVLAPDTLLRTDPYANGASPVEQTRFLIPLVNNGLPAGGRVLALNGMVLPPEAVSVSPAGVFERVSERFEAAASALRGLGSSDRQAQDLVAIESVRLRVTVIHPTSGSRVIERVLYRAPGAASLAADADETERRVRLVSELARTHSLGFVTGSLAPGYVLDETLDELERLAPLIRAWSDPDLAACHSLDCLPQPKLDLDPSGTNVATFAAFFDREMPIEAGSVVYRDAPNVVRVSQALFSSDAPRVFDIMSNARRAFRFADGRPVPAPDLVLAAGVAETHLERLALGLRGSGSTIERPAGARGSLELRAWIDAPPQLAGTAPTESEMIDRALSSGSVVVTAAQTANPDTPLGWWQIDPSTGRTLGMTRYGGATLAEYVLLGFGGSAAILGGAAATVCALSPRRRQLNGRIYTATVLSCAYCTVAQLGHDPWGAGAPDAFTWCVDKRGGWEPG